MKKSKTYKGLLIKRRANQEGDKAEDKNRLLFSLIDINRRNSLAELYKALECETIDIQERYINGKIYDFIIDDEYLLNGKTTEPSNAVAIGTRNGQILEVIYGGLFICGLADDGGAETSLTDKDLENILTQGRGLAENQRNGEAYEMIYYNFEDETKTDGLKTAKA